MRKFKKALAFALASAMIVSAVPVSAATTNTAKASKTTIYTNGKKNVNNVTWIKTTTAKGYTVKLTNKTTSIISLSGKKVTAKKAGAARVDVTFYKGGKKVSTKKVWIKVKTSAYVQGASIAKSELNVGETTKVSTTNADEITPYYYSADKNVVTVNKTTGEVKAIGAGSTTISVYNANTGKSVKLPITVNAEFAAKQSGAKKITVTGSGFTKETKVEVKRGNTTVDVDTSKIEVTSDGKTMILPVKSTISAAEYTVTAGEKTAKFTGEASKVTTIDVSDVAVVDKNVTLPITPDADSKGALATIGYTVKNQFGEDITKTTNVQANASRTKESDPSQGSFKVKLNAYDKADDEISVVIINTETGLSVSKNVKISNAATANEVTIKGIYNENKKDLTEDVKVGDLANYYLLLDVVDQYGKNMAESKDFTVGTTMDSSLIVSAAPGATNVTVKADGSKATVKTVDGKDYIAVPLTRADKNNTKISAGKVSVVLITKAGKTFTGEFEVASGVKVDTFSASPSDVVVAGKETVFDFTALDTYGNDISDKVTKEMFATSTQQSLFDSNSGTGYFKFAKNSKTGKNELIFVAPAASADRVFVASFITATNKVVNVQFTIKADAHPVSLESKSDFGMIAEAGRESTLKAKNVKVTDQYGTNYKFTTFSAKPSNAAEGTYSLVLTLAEGSSVALSNEVSSEAKFTVVNEGTTKFTLTLYNGTKAISSEDFSVVAKELKDVVSSAEDVVITDIPKMYAKSDRELEVKAKINGMEVKLEKGKDYTVSTNDTVEGDVVSPGAIKIEDGKTEATGKYTVIIKAGDGIEIIKNVTVSNEDRKAETAKVKDAAAEISHSDSVDVETVLGQLEVKDQYGEVMTNISGARVRFTNYAEGAKVENNNTSSAKITLGENTSATAKVTFAGGYTYTFTIVAK